MVARSTAEITSAQPATASRARASHSTRAKPNAVIAPPQTQTAAPIIQVRLNATGRELLMTEAGLLPIDEVARRLGLRASAIR